MLDREQRRDFYRLLETASARQLQQELADLEYALEIARESSAPVPEEIRDLNWLLRATREEIQARAEVEAILRRHQSR